MEVLNFNDADFCAEPHAALSRAREAGPFCWIEPSHILGVTRYDDVATVMKDPGLYSSSGMDEKFPPIKGAELFAQSNILLANDPPSHGRLRRLLQRAFTNAQMVVWEEKIARIVDDLITKIEQHSSFDLIRDLAIPLPVAVVAEMLGVDVNRRLDFKRWSDDMVSVRTVLGSQDAVWRARREREIVASCAEFSEYFGSVIEARRRDPDGQDLISALVRASADEELLRPEEVMGLSRLVLFAGNETTTNFLGNAMVALLNHRDQWQMIVDEPELALLALEEALRFDGPVVHLVRRVTRDTELAGRPIPAGTIVAPILASANRDPRRFVDPDRFDIRREARDHLAFGLGIHKCIGAQLARMEMRMALQQMATRLRGVRFSAFGKPQRLGSLFLRGYQSLPLQHGPQPEKGYAMLGRRASLAKPQSLLESSLALCGPAHAPQ